MPAGGRRRSLAGHLPPGYRYQNHSFYAGFLLIIVLFSEEFARALEWFRVRLKGSPRYRIIVYPLLLLLIVAAAFIIFTSLIKFSTTLTFSYD